MTTSTKKNVQLIVSTCVEFGLKYVVISPGSRNAPLIIAFNQHPEISCIAIPDERSAAFFALGMAQQTNSLVGVLCTSGSAALNYYPAIAEAYYQRIPLFVFTADRPQSWVNQGDGQTIVQHDLYRNHINYSFTFDDSISSEDTAWVITRELSTAYDRAEVRSKGPVHINIAFREPLYEQVELKEIQQTHLIRFEQAEKKLSADQQEYIKTSWKKFSKKMIICGQMTPDVKLLEELKLLSDDSSLVILVENTSNLVYPSFIHCIDRTLNGIEENQIEVYKPDLLIYLGGAIVSKRIKAFLRKNKPLEHWKIGENFPEMDTFQSVQHSFNLPEKEFIQTLNLLRTDSDSNYGHQWKQLDYLIQEKVMVYQRLDKQYSDLAVFQKILDCVPEQSHLHLANSSVIRYSLLFDPVSSIKYWCNRGTSGIDGSMSTAAGAAFIQRNDWHTLIIGDMSFFYDSNAFWNHALQPNLRIFLINNGGGSIFNIIPGPDTTQEKDEFFVFNNNFKVKELCSNFNLEYFYASSIEEIDQQMEAFYTFEEKGKPKIMEIDTKNSANEKILSDFFKKIKLS